jgi:hypothetical protein
MRIQAFAMGLALAWATVGVARADDVLFTISNGGKTVASFELSLNPTPNGPTIFNYFFSLSSVPAMVGGSQTTLPNLTFYSALGGGGFFAKDVFAKDVFNFSGQQLYSDSTNAPTFTPGSYQLVDTDARTRKTETVTLTRLFTDPLPDPPALSIPEPSTWAMLLFGFVALSYAGYRKARTPTIN